jgi:hypothetical protein
MSVRRKQTTNNVTLDPELLRSELQEMRNSQMKMAFDQPMGAGMQTVGVVADASREFDKLTPTEQQAATLGVHPESFKPLSELNNAHFEVLRQANALAPNLEAQIRAFRAVAEGTA